MKSLIFCFPFLLAEEALARALSVDQEGGEEIDTFGERF